MGAIKGGWIPFSAFCNKYGIKRDGNQYRKLKELDPVMKSNISSTDQQARWLVDEKAACRLWGKIIKNN